MLILIFSLIVFESVDVKPARDSTIQQIKQGRWEDAITNAKFVLIHESEDDLLLGVIRFAEVKGFISELNPKYKYLLNKKKSNIIKTWKKFYKENKDNENILQILAILYLDTDLEKTKLYANRILELDSLNSFACFILGYASEKNDNYNEALIYYQKSFLLDTMFTDCLPILANLYIITGNYDSALVHFSKIHYEDKALNAMRIGKIICQLKNENITGAVTTLDRLKNSELFECTRNSIEVIQEYIDGVKENSLIPSDSFIIFIPVVVKQLNLHSPTNLVAILTVNNIAIMNLKVDKEKPLSLPTSINREIIIVPCYALEDEPMPFLVPKPKYPESARRAGLEGEVVVKALVDINGSVLDVKILVSSGIKDLDNAALFAAKNAKYEPITYFGIPVRVWSNIPIKFKLTGK